MRSITEIENIKFSLYGNPQEEVEKINYNYFPLPFEKYIIVSNDGGFPYWKQVIDITAPILAQKDIYICNINLNGGNPLNGSFPVNTKNIRHYAYLAKNAICLISDNEWILELSKNLNHLKINDENPEVVAQYIFDKCKIDINVNIETVLVGPDFGVEVIEIIPDFNFHTISRLPKSPIGIRCDLFKNWKFAMDAVSAGTKPIISISSKIPTSILPFLKGCERIDIFLGKGIEPESVREIEKLGIPYILVCYDDQNVEELKFQFFDFKPIQVSENWGKNNVDKLLGLRHDTYIESKRKIVSKNGTFNSLFHLKNNIKSSDPRGNNILAGAEDKDFLEEAEVFLYYIKK